MMPPPMPPPPPKQNNNGTNDESAEGYNQGGIKFGTSIVYEDEAYSNVTNKEEYVSSLPTNDEESDDDSDDDLENAYRNANSNHPSSLIKQAREEEEAIAETINPFENHEDKTTVSTIISERESDYQKRRHDRKIILEDGVSFKEAMMHVKLEREEVELLQEARQLEEKSKEHQQQEDQVQLNQPKKRRRRRWDVEEEDKAAATQSGDSAAIVSDSESSKSKWDEDVTKTSSSRRKRWDETPVIGSSSAADATPLITSNNQWDETPMLQQQQTTTTVVKKSRWDSTPAPNSTPLPSSQQTPLSGDLARALAVEKEMDARNRPWTDAALDAILPIEGYTILRPPPSYHPLRTPSRKLLSTPTPLNTGFNIPTEEQTAKSINEIREAYGIPTTIEDNSQGQAIDDTSASALPPIKKDDMQYFGRLLQPTVEETLTKAENIERQIMTLLLKIKSGTPPQRKTAMRHITDKARFFGPSPLFNQILPLLLSPTLEDQERHLLVKVIDRVLYKLDDLVRPYVHKILAVIEPLLIDEDYYARMEGREIISNLSKAAGLATMIATMRPDIDNPDEYVRNTTSRAFAVVASALGVSNLVPFLKAVCLSKKSWQARHTGIKIIQQIAVLMGCAILPYLRELVDIIQYGFVNFDNNNASNNHQQNNMNNNKIKTITALTCAALAEASHPYGIESFDCVIKPLWKGALENHGKNLAAYLKAIGYIIPLMEEMYASRYTKMIMPILIREFNSPDEEMKRIVLKVIKQCVSTDGVESEYIKKQILPDFFRCFWIRRMALDKRNHAQVLETTEELANKVGVTEIVSRIVNDLKDDSEPFRRMVMETIQKVLTNLGAGDVDSKLEERLIDGILYAFQEQAVDAGVMGAAMVQKDGQIMLDGFGCVINALGERTKPYLKQIVGTIKWRLNNKAPSVRMQAADLIARIAFVMNECKEEQLMGHLGVVLYEYLGEEYPEVLGSILGALRAIVNVIGMTNMTPPISDLLPRLTPILRNRHEKVQENCIDLVGRIADRGAEYVSAKEWMRICFELLEMLKAHKKAIRRAAVSTFGYIAKAIGPQDVLHTLLNNLKVQDRQMRVCTTVAIAIVAETCGPFTVLPALMNEYRVPELNIQNGVLKATSFMFEYIGEMGVDYIYAVTPLLTDALMDRDQVHRQTACAAVKHLALGVQGLGCEDALIHLLNYVWPNIFEQSPHVIQAVLDAVEGFMVSLGPQVVFMYVLQGLFHPSRRVRDVYWRVFNTLYIYASDSMVMSYPVFEDEGEQMYKRTTLELFI